MDQLVAAEKAFDLAISGMTCASCVARVEKSLARVPGVRQVSVNLITETAHIEAGPGTRLGELISSVGRAGYRASEKPIAELPPDRRAFWEVIAAALLSAPILLAMLIPLPGWLLLGLATPVQFWLGGRFYLAGFKALRAGAGNMDLLIALGTSAAYFLSVVDFAHGGPLYFEASAMVITLIRLGKYLESRAKHAAARAVSGLADLRPALAHRADGKDVPLDDIHIGDLLEIYAGERVPVDGIIAAGAGYFDESHLTGESLPVLHETGGKLLAGALNLDAVLRLRAGSPPGESFLDRMSRLIADAQASKPRIQLLADRIAAFFVPVVLLIALLTCLAWLLHGATFGHAVLNAVAVLVIACPCALGLATPAAILAGTGAAAKRGILIRNADALERGARIDFVAFDKTGTLTEGRPELLGTQTLSELPQAAVLQIAAALTVRDNHPLSLALRVPGATPAEDTRILPGRGVEGSVGGKRYILGSAALIRDAGGVAASSQFPAHTSLSYLALADGSPLAAFGFADRLRPQAQSTITRLRQSGYGVMLLSGDRAPAAAAIAEAAGIAEIIADAAPADKQAAVSAKRQAGYRVAMVGDGVNDAAAVAGSDLGITIGNAADMTFEAADISLLRPDLALVPEALALCRQTWRVLQQGLIAAMLYNLVFIPLAAFGFLNPALSSAVMAASSLSVLANALRLRRWTAA